MPGLHCPLCAGPTEVTETRKVSGGLRRLRHCRSTACTGRLTTIELPFVRKRGTGSRGFGGYVAVAVSAIRQASAAVANLLPGGNESP